MNIPFVDLKAQNGQVFDEIMESWRDILTTAGFVGGKYVKDFEDRFAKLCNSENCVAVSNGTTALITALFALDVKSGDEVILPANTFIATAEAVQNIGAIPVLVDCEKETWNIDPSLVESKISENTVGIIGVHLYGQACDMKALRKVADTNNLWLMEDSAQAHLATLEGNPCGSMGDIAAFSFYPGKNLGAAGEGGAITTNDRNLARRARLHINHGSEKKYHHTHRGTNSRMSAVIAASLCAKLEPIVTWTENRRKIANRYMSEIVNDKILLPVVAESSNPVWHLFVVHAKNRHNLSEHLKSLGVSIGMHYPVPIHLQPQFRDYGYNVGDFPNAEFNASNCLSLPMFETMTDEQVDYVINAMNNFGE